jgi:hypothetical protein
MKTGIEIITEERQRQIAVEGWTSEHDEQHKKGELAFAGAKYAEHAAYQSLNKFNNSPPPPKSYVSLLWPWDQKWWKPTDDPIRNLAKAGALIAAEIDRLQRKNL